MTTGPNRDGDQAIHGFLADCARRLSAVADGDPAERGARVFANALARSEPTPERYDPTRLPVLDTIDRLDDGPLARHFGAVAPLLPWIPSPRSDDGGTTMALCPLDRTRDFGGPTVGMMYLAPGVQYPLHSHPPQELYLTVAGEGHWRWGGHDDLRAVGPERSLYNHPGDQHTAIAGSRPVVALYVLWADPTDPTDPAATAGGR